ncbi:MAG: helicase-related protein, partial [Planctomycetota bacterium]
RQAELAAYLEGVDLSGGAGPKLKQILMRGVGVHHAGVMPRYRRVVEELFQRKLLAMCVCTETLAAGINLPARSVVLPSLLKGPKTKRKLVETATAQQIFGRAGRPQFDDRGFVYALAHEDDVKHFKWKEKYDSIPEDTKDPGLLKAKKQLKKKMPKRRAGETYWTPQQFEQLQLAKSADLASRGQIPWRLLAYLLGCDEKVQPIRDLVGKRLLPPKKVDEAKRELNRMLITLWQSEFIELQPEPTPVSRDGDRTTTPHTVRAKESSSVSTEPSAGTRGLFGEFLDQMRADEGVSGSENVVHSSEDDSNAEQAVQEVAPVKLSMKSYDLDGYRPETATGTEKLDRLIHLRSINPLFGVYMADLLAEADDQERILAFESVLEVPGTVARLVRVPSLDEIPAGKLATERLDPQLLQLGLATPEELGAREEDGDDGEIENRGFGRVMFDEPRVWPLTLGEKIFRLFQNDFPGVSGVRVRPVWIVGELLHYDGDFNKFVTTKKLQKEEGILLRHCLRMILFLDEMANVPPKATSVETWEDWLDDLAAQLTKSCEAADPQTTEEVLSKETPETEELVSSGRRK